MSQLPTLQPQPVSLLAQKCAELGAKRTVLLTAFSKAAERNRPTRLRRLYQRIRDMNEMIDTLNELEEASAQKNGAGSLRRFTVSSLFLHECYRQLTRDRDEQFVFITGVETDGVCVLDQSLELKHERRTMVGVTADPRSTHRLLIRLERFGHRLLGHFHSHPGNGPESTHPSGTDENFQRRLESAGHVAVCAIFSRDGFVRFLRLDENFEIDIFGKGVQRHEGNVFRLTDLD